MGILGRILGAVYVNLIMSNGGRSNATAFTIRIKSLQPHGYAFSAIVDIFDGFATYRA
jgi:hypothetical protein